MEKTSPNNAAENAFWPLIKFLCACYIFVDDNVSMDANFVRVFKVGHVATTWKISGFSLFHGKFFSTLSSPSSRSFSSQKLINKRIFACCNKFWIIVHLLRDKCTWMDGSNSYLQNVTSRMAMTILLFS